MLTELMEEEVADVVGPKGRHDPERSAVRHSHGPGEVTLGGQPVAVERRRVGTADGSQEVPLESYRHFGAESAIEDAAEELAERGFDRQYVHAVRETIESAVTQRSGEAWIVVAIRVVAALYVASQWVRGVGRGLDAVLERPHASASRGRQLRDALALVLLFSGAVLLQFAGSRIATGVFGEGVFLSGRRVPARGDRRGVRVRLHLRGRRHAAAPTARRDLWRPRWRACCSGSP